MNSKTLDLPASDTKNTSSNKTTLRRKILSLAIIQAMACSTTAVYAANITVNSAADDNVTNDGICTLREAIAAANTDLAVDSCTAGDAGADTINFDNSLSGSTVTLAGSQLDITSDLSIDGDLNNDGTPDIEIKAGGVSRVINISPASANIAVTLEGLTISGGNGNTGGGVNSEYGYVYKYGPVYTALTISSSVISGNTANGSGGGIAAYGYGGNTVTINNSRISGNTATNGSGGGIYTNYGVSLNDSTISGNTAGASGGGTYSRYGASDITNSTVSGNTATNTGGGIYGGSGNIVMTNSTISGNNASDTGGGISFDNGTATMTNSTVSGNTATNTGGGIYSYSGTINMTNSTISNNSAGTSGGGVYFKDTYFSTLNIYNSILANNTNADCAGTPPAVTGSNNLVEDEGSCNILTNTASLLTVDPQLGALADNGGATKTHLPQAGSPVLDAGDNTDCGTGLTVDSDQRGATRDDGSCDIGAVEGSVSLLPLTSVQFDNSTATVSEDGSSITINLTRSGDTVSAISVDYTTSDGTATAPTDYTANMNTLNFATGVTSQSITVDITDDTDVEGDENFSLALSNVQLVAGSAQVALGANTSTTVTITDNDAATGTDTTTSTDSGSSTLALSPGWMLLLGFTGWLRRKFK